MDFPIEIDDDIDNKVYAQIAYLLDGTEIITEITEIRNKFKITQPFAPGDYDAWYNHLLQLAGFDLKVYKEMDKISPDANKSHAPDWDKKSKWLKAAEPNFIKHTMLYRDFSNSIARIRHIYHYPPIFDDVIIQVVLFKKVTRFKTALANWSFERPYNPIHDPERPEDPVITIVVTPSSTKEDVLAAFEDGKAHFKTETGFVPPFESKLDNDTKSKIKDFRKWYWMNHETNPNRMGYRNLEKITGVKIETIRSGIRAYANFLKSSL